MQGASCAFQCWKAWLFHALNILLLRRTNSMEMNVLSPEEELQKLYWLGQWEGYFPDAIVLAMKIWPLSIRSCLMVVYFHPHRQKWCFLFTLWSMNEVISPILCLCFTPSWISVHMGRGACEALYLELSILSHFLCLQCTKPGGGGGGNSSHDIIIYSPNILA